MTIKELESQLDKKGRGYRLVGRCWHILWHWHYGWRFLGSLEMGQWSISGQRFDIGWAEAVAVKLALHTALHLQLFYPGHCGQC